MILIGKLQKTKTKNEKKKRMNECTDFWKQTNTHRHNKLKGKMVWIGKTAEQRKKKKEETENKWASLLLYLENVTKFYLKT